MRNARNKSITRWVVVAGLVTLVVAALAMKDRALEEWYLWRLDSEDAATRIAAAEALAEVGTKRSLPKVFEKLDEIPLINEYFDQYGDHLPAELRKEVDDLRDRLVEAKQAAG